MSNQIDITGGARVRGLNGVITGTTGVLNSLPINAPNGIPQLDSSGKILVSQLPNSVMEFLGTWNAATNTPTLANGTGNAGDVYLCNVAGTVNFGAGPIAFIVGDYVVYSGSTWERSGGAMGTVTSVAASITGNSIGLTGSPITTAGTLAFAFAGTNLQYINGAGNLTTFPTLITSIGLSMPSAFSVANSPLTANGTIAVTGAGTASQYIRGDGQLATFPTTGGGGSSVYYYLNGSVNASVAGYKQMSNTAVIGMGTNFSLVGNGLVAEFLTDAGNPNRLLIPSGAWNFEMFFSMSSSGGNQKFYLDLLKYDGSTFTLIASTSTNPEEITGGTTTDLYITSMAVTETILLATDRLALRVYIVDNAVGRTSTLHTEDNNLCQIITTFSTGVSSLNGLTANTQYFAVGTSGMDFNINSLVDTHTFNLPTASSTKRGALSSADWTLFNSKADNSLVVHLAGDETITGFKQFTSTYGTWVDYGISIIKGNTPASLNSGSVHIYSALGDKNLVIASSFTSFAKLQFQNTGNYTYTFPAASGTIALVGGSGVGTVTSVAALTIGTSGTDLSSTVANSTTTPVITLNVPTASATNRGALSSTDWTTFNGKQNALTNPVTGTGTSGYIPKFTGASTIGNSAIQEDGALMTIASGISALRFNATNSYFQYDNSLTIGIPASYSAIRFDNSGNTDIYGSLRINTLTDAGYKLDVNGTGRFSGNVQVGSGTGLSQLTVGNGLGYTGVVLSNSSTVYSWLLGSQYNVNNAFEITPSTAVGGSTFTTPVFKILNTGAATFSSSVTATNAIFERANDSGVILRIGNTGSTYFDFSRSSTTGALLIQGNQTGNNNILIAPTSGNVGIGTSSPTEKLDVIGGAVAAGNGTIRTGITYSTLGLIGTFTNHDLGIITNGTTKLTLTSTGNLGLGVTPSAGGLSGYALFEIASGGASIYSGANQNLNGTNISWSGGTATYKISNFASLYNQQSGQHQWFNAPSGTAGAAITFTQAMTLTAAGVLTLPSTGSVEVGYGSVQGTYKLDVNGTGRFRASAATYAGGSLILTSSAGTNPIYLTSNGGYFALSNGAGADHFLIASTGAATFSSSVTAKSNLSGTNTGFATNDASGYGVGIGYVAGSYGYITSQGASSPLVLAIDGTEKVRLTSGGNVGIGTSSPNSVLEVYGQTRISASLGSVLLITPDATSTNGVTLDTSYYGSAGYGPLKINAGGTERMRITSGGDVCIGITSALQPAANRGTLTINGASTSLLSLGAGGVLKSYYYVSTSGTIIENIAVGTALSVYSGGSGGVTLTSGATSWTSLSDERLKNINGTIQNALEKIMTLRAVNFSWKNDESKKENLGFIAQDVEKVFPQVIDKNKLPNTPTSPNTDETEYLNVRYTELIPVLVKAIQEQQAEINELKQLINK